MACAVTISAVTLVYFTVVIASRDICKMAVLSDTQLREEIRNEVNFILGLLTEIVQDSLFL